MIDVTNAPMEPRARCSVNLPYLIAGKSGTAQVFKAAANERVRKAGELQEHLRDHALFIAFAPADAPMPKIAVAVVVENAPGGGGAFAAPIARRVLDSYLLTPGTVGGTGSEAKRAAAAAAAVAAARHSAAAPHRLTRCD